MPVTHLRFLSLWTFKGKKYEKGPFTPPIDFISIHKVGLNIGQWILDKKCQSVWILNFPETVINFAIILLL